MKSKWKVLVFLLLPAVLELFLFNFQAVTGRISGDKALEGYSTRYSASMLPQEDGLSILKKLRTMHETEDLPIIMLTANAVAGAKEQYIALGFKDFLAKPIFSDQLEAMVRKYLPAEMVERGAPISFNGHGHSKRSKVPELEEFDYEYAMAVWKNEDSLYGAMQDFYESIPKVKATLAALIDDISQEEARKEYRMHLHTLKGTSAMVGALLLSKLSRIMEVAAQESQIQRLQALHPIMMEELDKHRQRLEMIAPQKSKGTKQEIRDVLEMLQDALEREDYTMADFLVKQLELFETSGDLEEAMTQLFDGVMSLNTDRALAVIEDILRDF